MTENNNGGINTEVAEEYARKLYHFLRTEQTETFALHVKNPEIKGFGASLVCDKAGRGTFHYMYINENEEIIRKERKV